MSAPAPVELEYLGALQEILKDPQVQLANLQVNQATMRFIYRMWSERVTRLEAALYPSAQLQMRLISHLYSQVYSPTPSGALYPLLDFETSRKAR